ncbi:AAA family ATPase [Candidatus Micrarchaeota archaeon]|nr:AAA family ATPase [Candidatus Micrarchaeota archaeon]
MRSIIFASGKGGVGRTSILINTGLVLSSAGKKTLVIDADIAMANIGILLGVERAPINLHHVLMGETDIKDAIYEGPGNLKYVPAGLSIERITKLDFNALKDAVKKLEEYDFVLIDCPAGMSDETQAAILSANEMVLVLTPEPASLANALKVKTFAERKNVELIGFILNMIRRDRTEIKRSDLESVLDLKCIAEIPEDTEVRRSSALQVPVAIRAPHAPFMRGIKNVASFLTGGAVVEVKAGKSFLARLIDFILGRRT